MHEIFWIDPPQLCGRCGPESADWNLAELKAAGIGAILSVNEGTLCEPKAFETAGLIYARHSLSPHAPPEAGDFEHNLEVLPQAYAFIQAQIQAGRAVLVHCRSGKDRTGLMLAYYLIRSQGLTIEAAIQTLIRIRPIALTAPGWREFAPEVLRQIFENGSGRVAEKLPE